MDEFSAWQRLIRFKIRRANGQRSWIVGRYLWINNSNTGYFQCFVEDSKVLRVTADTNDGFRAAETSEVVKKVPRERIGMGQVASKIGK
jgi:hypothetical protein